MGIGGRDRRLRPRLCRRLSGSERGDGHRFPLLLDRQPVLDPQLLRDRPHQCARGAHRAHGRDVGRHQRHLARAQALRQRPDLARGVHALPALGAGILAALRRLGLPHHAAQRRLLVLPPRRLHGARRQHRAHPRREVSLLLPAHERVGGPLDYFQWAAILRSVSALTAYHWVYRESVKPWLIADLLILRDEMPRSLASCYENLVRYLDHIARAYGRQGPAQRQARAIRARLENSRMEEIFQQRTARIHRRIHRRQQPARRRHHRAVSDVGQDGVGTDGATRQLLRYHAPCFVSAVSLPSLVVRFMRIRISHLTSYRYGTPATSVIQMLRLTPRNHDGQYVARWRIDVSTDCRLDQHEDAFGNITHTFTADGPFSELAVHGRGRGRDPRHPGHRARRGRAVSAEPLSARDRADHARCRHRRLCRRAAATPAMATCSTSCIVMLERLHDDMTYDTDPTQVATTAARSLRAQARRLPGPHPYLHRGRAQPRHSRRAMSAAISTATTASTEQEAGHAWAEAFVPELGWVGFDPANGLCATDAHVRVAVGLDYLGAAPLRGTRYGGGGEVAVGQGPRRPGQPADAELRQHCRSAIGARYIHWECGTGSRAGPVGRRTS